MNGRLELDLGALQRHVDLEERLDLAIVRVGRVRGRARARGWARASG